MQSCGGAATAHASALTSYSMIETAGKFDERGYMDELLEIGNKQIMKEGRTRGRWDAWELGEVGLEQGLMEGGSEQ